MARLWEVLDYVLTDAVNDPNRIALLVERARINRLPELSEIERRTKLQHRQIVEMLAELRSVLKDPVVAGSTGTRILVVEDDKICGEMAKQILERNGFDVLLATTADETKTALARHRPALVLMDIHLGSTDGLRLVRSVRRGHTCPKVPVIIGTSDGMRGTVLEAIEANVQGYLPKPYQARLLVENIKRVLAESRRDAFRGPTRCFTSAS